MTENSETEQKEIIPIRLLQAIGALLLFTLLIVAYARLSDMPLLGVPKASPVLREIVLDFQKKNDGSIVILDESGKELINSKFKNNTLLRFQFLIPIPLSLHLFSSPICSNSIEFSSFV